MGLWAHVTLYVLLQGRFSAVQHAPHRQKRCSTALFDGFWTVFEDNFAVEGRVITTRKGEFAQETGLEVCRGGSCCACGTRKEVFLVKIKHFLAIEGEVRGVVGAEKAFWVPFRAREGTWRVKLQRF